MYGYGLESDGSMKYGAGGPNTPSFSNVVGTNSGGCPTGYHSYQILGGTTDQSLFYCMALYSPGIQKWVDFGGIYNYYTDPYSEYSTPVNTVKCGPQHNYDGVPIWGGEYLTQLPQQDSEHNTSFWHHSDENLMACYIYYDGSTQPFPAANNLNGKGFGGMYSPASVGSVGHVNPITNAMSCPAGFSATKVSGRPYRLTNSSIGNTNNYNYTTTEYLADADMYVCY